MPTIIGDQIPEGTYNSVHSRFEKVINFDFYDDFVISLVKPSVGAGPYNVVVSENINLSNIFSLQIKKGCVNFNKSSVFDSESSIYNSNLPVIPLDDLKNGLIFLLTLSKELSNDKSLMFLLDKDIKFNAFNSFDKAFKQISEEAANDIFVNNNLIKAVSKLKGLGYGLTPSGDDFIAGVLLGLNLYELFNKNLHITLKNSIFDMAKSENKISNIGLLAAKEGRCNEKFYNLLSSLSNGNDRIIHQNFNNFLQIGETSGADFFSGFFLTIKKYLCL